MKINFKYSWIYDCHWKEVYKDDKEYPTPKQVQSYMLRVEKLWRKDETKILKELSLVAGLKWKEKSVICYVVGRCKPFSDPLTIKVYKNYSFDYFVDVLTHELVHQLFTQGNNEKLSKKAWAYFHSKYKN